MKLWIARHGDDRLFVTDKKPHLVKEYASWECEGNYEEWELPLNEFPEVTFENSPKQVELKIID